MMDLSDALDKYYGKFGENYPLCISACREDAEIIAEIEECVTTGKKAKKMEYTDNIDY